MQVQKSNMRRVHWRLRLAVLAWASLMCVLLLLRLGPAYVLVMWLVLMAGGGYADRRQLWLYGVLYRWRSAAAGAGLTAAGLDGKVHVPALGRVWASADVVRVEFTPHEGKAVKAVDTDRMAAALGLRSARIETIPASGFRGSRAYVELRRTRQLPTKEVQSVVNVWGLPEISVAELPRVPGVSDQPGVLCLECRDAGRAAGEYRLIEGYDYLPHDCRPHYVWRPHTDSWEASSTIDYGIKGRGHVTCDRWSARDMGQPPSAEQLAEWAGGRPPVPQPVQQNWLPSRGTHNWCMHFFRQRAAAISQGRRPSNVLVQHAGPVATWREALDEVTIGHGIGETPWRLRLIDNHVLIAGLTGSGKGSVIWSTIVGLAPAIAAGAVKVWGIDPKRVELNMGRGIFDQYAADPESMLALLERAVDLMTMRSDLLVRARKRRFEPGPEHPLFVIVIDELGHLASMYENREYAARFDRALTTLLNLGRSMGFVLIGGLQDPRKKVIDSRDLWPTKVALRMPRPMVDLVLGAQAYANGAMCDQIPEHAQGTAFVVDPSNLSEPREVRAGWVSDEAILLTEQALVAWREHAEEAARRVVVAAGVSAPAAPTSLTDRPQVAGAHRPQAIGEATS